MHCVTCTGTRDIKDNQSSCLQMFLDLEPSRATGPRVYNRSFHLNQRVKPQKTNETFNTGRTSDHVTSKLEKKNPSTRVVDERQLANHEDVHQDMEEIHERDLYNVRETILQTTGAIHPNNTAVNTAITKKQERESVKEGSTTKTPNMVKIARS